MDTSVNDLITKLKLKSHPEGGFYKEMYRSPEEILKENLPKVYNGNRNYATSIYFLLTSENFSAFHKINQDEIWHFYMGSPLQLHVISDEGDYHNQTIGIDIKSNQVPQFVVKGGSWFAAEIKNKEAYSLLGCTVSPGFNFDDFELASRDELIKLFPSKKEIITRLTRK